jgi:IS30 family transposase
MIPAKSKHPSPLSPEKFEQICCMIEEQNIGLKKACDSLHISHRSFYDFLNVNDTEEHQKRSALAIARYTRARTIRAHNLADEIPEIADEKGDPQVTRNRIDARKWAASKYHPDAYGDRMDVKTDGRLEITVKTS